ncbi:MAG: metal-sulfur cluster assembly factor [Bacteroidetes bacterium]|nr:metal-sulfur cluster assembly factor [Bacteroidota bacterium]
METHNEANKTEKEIYETLRTVIDPELGINIIDLGLIYKIEYVRNKGIQIELTLSSKGCPMGDVIINNVDAAIRAKFPDTKLDIQLVWEPAWTTDRVTLEGKTALGYTD